MKQWMLAVLICRTGDEAKDSGGQPVTSPENSTEILYNALSYLWLPLSDSWAPQHQNILQKEQWCLQSPAADKLSSLGLNDLKTGSYEWVITITWNRHGLPTFLYTFKTSWPTPPIWHLGTVLEHISENGQKNAILKMPHPYSLPLWPAVILKSPHSLSIPFPIQIWSRGLI